MAEPSSPASPSEQSTVAPASGLDPHVPQTAVAAERLGRFEVHGEIGRGGMGAVLRGRDPLLNRELALKVLLADQGDAEAQRRFVEEAQIGGQLQHPGLVPVYELGADAAGRPFFAMKLIDGHTLAELLNQRPSPSHDLSRFVQIFEQVCQAVAYAHSKGVLHRDLKPSNVMVGAFGEVQVMDWGLAKRVGSDKWIVDSEDRKAPSLLPTNHSPLSTLQGAVLGTPGYLAPEQVRGERERIDARTDVFGLGGILCEILTGQPPCRGPGSMEKIMQAAGGDLTDAYVRLDGCGADAELVRLAKACLAVDPKDRPRDGSEAAAQTAAYRAGVEERLRRAELKRAAAEARQRTQLLLAAAVLLLIVLGGSGGWYFYQQRQEREAERTRLRLEQEAERTRQEAERSRQETELVARLDGDLAEFTDRLSRAQKARLDDFAVQKELLAEARTALQRAEGRLGNAGPAAQRERVRQAAEQLRLRRRDQDMLARLDEARLQPALSETTEVFDHKGADVRYQRVFADYDLDVTRLPFNEAVKRLRASPLREQLVTALDDWASHTLQRQVALRALANAADSSDWSRRSRRARGFFDVNAMRKVKDDAPWDKIPASSAFLLAEAFRQVGQPADAAAVLERARQAHPDDFWIYFKLASVYDNMTPPQWAESVRYATAAAALRPQSALVHYNLGVYLSRLERSAEAFVEFQTAVRLQPNEPDAHLALGGSLFRQSKYAEAESEFRSALRLQPARAGAHSDLGNALAQQGKRDEAVAEYREGLRLKPDDADVRYNLGTELRNLKKLDEAVTELQYVVRLKPDFLAARINLGATFQDQRKWAEAAAEYRQAIRISPNFYLPHYTLGQTLQADGKLPEAAAEFREAVRLQPDKPEFRADLAGVLKAQGQLAEAVAQYKELLRLKKDDWAEAGLKDVVRLDPKLFDARLALGDLLAGRGEMGSAAAEYKEAVRLKPDDAGVHYKLAKALVNDDQLPEAAAAFKEVVRLKPDHVAAYFDLGEALEDLGRFAEALAAVRRGCELGAKTPGAPADAAQRLRHAERRVELDKQLPAILKGDAKPKDAAEQIELAELCTLKRWHVAALRFYRDAFTAKPDLERDLNAGHRYNAACAAALAGCGKAEDPAKPDAAEQARLRRQALTWLRDDLAAWTKRADDGKPESRDKVKSEMNHWQQDDDLDGVRDGEELDKLPAEERPEWRKLWSEVGILRKKAEGK